ncbi:hypothetical protein ACSBL2_26790 [Pedobacter sp. AW31-3R]|uniref:hypothetical protein n=1 Tax=Pedobacter sp. AW31-3R TaxID=3445781 RepID=UPI003FA00E77
MREIHSLFVLAVTSLVLVACNAGPAKKKEKEKPQPVSKSEFDAIKGIRYTEVKRRFSNGLSFDTTGFQQEPSWIIELHSKDTILAYDPAQKIMQGFHLHYDHGNVYNFAKEWFRFKVISKDSLVFQRLQVSKKEIADDIRSDVNMTFYADSYIENVLHTTAAQLQKPTAADTAFIKKRVTKANLYPDNRDSVFAGRQIAVLSPKSDMISVELLSSVDPLMGRTRAYDYLYPRYKIVINRAYKDFSYEFNIIADEKGKLRLGYFYTNLPEFYEVRKKVLAGIVDVYLQNLLKIKPGSTLGIPHASEITVNVTGKKSAR